MEESSFNILVKQRKMLRSLLFAQLFALVLAIGTILFFAGVGVSLGASHKFCRSYQWLISVSVLLYMLTQVLSLVFGLLAVTKNPLLRSGEQLKWVLIQVFLGAIGNILYYRKVDRLVNN